MKNRIISCVVVILLLTLVVSADGYARLVDAAGLLDEYGSERVGSVLDEISERRCMDVAIATVMNTGGTDVHTFADEFYEERDYGYGSEHDGVILLISMDTRDYYISTEGYGLTVFTGDALDYVGESIVPYLSSGDYEQAFLIFAECTDELIGLALEGEPYHAENEPLSSAWIFICLLIGAVVAGIVVLVMVGSLKSSRPRRTADSYIKKGSFGITESRDLFLYRTLRKTPKPQNNSSNGNGAHRSSSGRVHGGGGGKF